MSKPPDLKQLASVPAEVVDAGAQGELVLFVGAGLSMLRGLPSWSGFAHNVMAWLRDQGKINFAELTQLGRLDPKKQLSIAKGIADDCSTSIDYKHVLGEARRASKIYDYVNAIGCVCVTTNYDELLEPRFEPKGIDEAVFLPEGADKKTSEALPPVVRVNEKADFLSKCLDEPGTVVHLHGSIGKPSTMVVTTQDYLLHYESPMVQAFLSDLFARKTVLFLGYGLDEIEVMEHALRKGKAAATSDRRRFALQGYFSHDTFVYQRMYDYYERSFGVHLIGYTLDHENFAQQEAILRDWSEKITVNKPSSIAGLAAINLALANG